MNSGNKNVSFYNANQALVSFLLSHNGKHYYNSQDIEL